MAITNGKVLYTATSDVHIKTFHIPYIKWLKSQGVEVHLAIERRGDVDLSFCDAVYYLPFKRSPFHLLNFKNLLTLRRLIAENSYQLVHCHTPTVSVLTRLAAFFSGNDQAAVLYTAHGFHFYKGSPWYLWALYYPIEKVLSAITDGIVTINIEDYELVKNKFWNKHTFKINGVGIDTRRFKTPTSEEKSSFRRKNGFSSEDFILIYVAEFIPRKNHKFLLESVPALSLQIHNLKVVLVGKGALLNSMKDLATRLHIEKFVNFLGWRDDVGELVAAADVGVSTSKQEGLGLGLAEEMLCSVPIVASLDRGHKEMIVHGENGFMFKQGAQQEFVKYMQLLYNDRLLREIVGKKAFVKSQEFVLENSLKDMAKIYRNYLK